ncbi:MAG: hypothetical protein HUJ96_10665 [Marinilabiliaceae bacterium]|nr:hypothetical protein [Marinilabiliaceae bacterium]
MNTIFTKESFLRCSFLIIVVFVLTSCGAKKTDSGSVDEGYYKNEQALTTFRWALENLDKTTHTFAGYDYWPDCGIRVTGSHLVSLISYKTMEELLGCPIYLSGPHSAYDGWNLNSEDFGHYNPEAIKRFISLEKQVLSDKAFVDKTSFLVDQYLRSKMRMLIGVYQILHRPDVATLLSRDEITDDEILYCLPCLNENTGVYFNVGNHIISFWKRRSQDGTADLIYEALHFAYITYYEEDLIYCFEEYEEEYAGDGDYDEYEEEIGEEYDHTEVEGREGELFIYHKGWGDITKFAEPTFKDAVKKLDQTTHTLKSEFDYWPESGLRVMGSHLASLLTIREVEQLIGCPLYVNGPHHEEWDLHCEYCFGQYNILAIRRLGELADEILRDEGFVNLTRPLIEKFLKRQMRYAIAIYQNLAEKDCLQDLYNAYVENNFNYYAVEMVGETSCLEDETFLFGNTGQSIQYFWARRYSDGTDRLIYNILVKIYNTYFHETDLTCK